MAHARNPLIDRTLRVALGALAILGLSAAGPAGSAPENWNNDWCNESWSDHSRAHACEVRDVTLAGIPKVLHVEPGENGGVEVAAGIAKAFTVKARVDAWAKTEADARALLAKIRIVDDAGGLHAVGPAENATSNRGPSWSASFRIEAPAATALELSTTNGPVGVYGMNGRMLLRTQNGPIAIEGGGGDVVARAENGPISVDLTGTRWVGRGLEARATNGPVSISIPKNYDAELEYGTLNGPWAGPRPVSKGQRDGYAYVRLGKGGAPLSVTTENGPFSLQRTSH